MNFERIDLAIANWMSRWGTPALRISLGIIFVWFGILKPFGISPAQALVERTVYWLPPEFFVPILGWWEVAIGICLVVRPLARVGVLLLFLQMPGTALPLLLLPDICFTTVPYGLTLEGQYIVKNLALVSAGLVLGGAVRREGRRRADRSSVAG